MTQRASSDTYGAISGRLSRRRALALAGGAAALAAVAPQAITARQDASATPVATTTPAAFPIPATIASDASPEFKTVAEALVEAMQRYRVPGVAIGILAGDREEHATFGVASINTLAPVTAETLFQIGSLSKTFTSTAIWGLHDQGALAIDAPVRTYLPDLRTADPAVAEVVQVGNLLDHSAGWYGDEGFDTGTGDDALARYVAERLPDLAQQFAVGEFFSYNNAAFGLLGRLVEVATGTTYNAAMESMIFGPLGLENTILDHAEVLRRPYADGHFAGVINGHDGLAVQTPLWVPRSVDPAGGIWSTTQDVLRYARFHLAATTDSTTTSAAVVSPESLLQMREPVLQVPGLPLSMARDWFVQDIDGIRVFSHNGDTAAQHTEFFAIPELDFAFVMLTNGSSGTSAAVEVVNAVMSTFPGLAGLVGKIGITQAGLAQPNTPIVTLPRETLDEYAGQYVDEATTYTLSVKDSVLEIAAEATPVPGTWLSAIGQGQPTFEISFAAKDEGLGAGVARIPFVRNDAGKVGWMSLGFRLIPRVA